MTPTEYLKQVPLLQQVDNELHPYGTCNTTSVAMCLYALGAKRSPDYAQFQQFEDELTQRCADNGYDRHSPEALKWLVEHYDKTDELHIALNWVDTGRVLQKVIAHIAKGLPCITHTYLTLSGHIVVLDGVRLDDDQKPVSWHLADPYGEFYPGGYDVNQGGDRELGRYWLSHNAFTARVLTDGQFWVHLIS